MLWRPTYRQHTECLSPFHVALLDVPAIGTSSFRVSTTTIHRTSARPQYVKLQEKSVKIAGGMSRSKLAVRTFVRYGARL